MRLPEKEKTFSQFLAAFSKSRLNFKYFEEKDDPHRFFILPITDSEDVFRWMPKKSHFRESFEKQHGKRAQELLKSPSQHIYQISGGLSRKLSLKRSLLSTCQILGLLVNTLAADWKYPVLKWHNLTIKIQMQLPK